MQYQLESLWKTVVRQSGFKNARDPCDITRFFAWSFVIASQASAQTWSLTNDQRRAYLNYYAPIILKRGDENDNKQGRDWITNFDFDQDNNVSNNRVNETSPAFKAKCRMRVTLLRSSLRESDR